MTFLLCCFGGFYAVFSSEERLFSIHSSFCYVFGNHMHTQPAIRKLSIIISKNPYPRDGRKKTDENPNVKVRIFCTYSI